jgi:D-psicose/D-tagatose/L-ribulose 3-epimerase
MRIAISNIAWEVSEDDEIAERLAHLGIDAIDIAPGKYFPEPEAATRERVLDVRTWWKDRGIEITGMQALLFGTSGLNLFGTADSQEAMLSRLAAIARIAGWMNAPRLVFGSPKNRDRGALTPSEAQTASISFFRRLGAIAEDAGVYFCLEPNPARYGCNFMLTTPDALSVVAEVDHPGIRMQLDAGAITINAEDPGAVIPPAASRIGHIHASEPDLVTLGDGGTDHATVSVLVRAHLANHVVCIEMAASKTEAPVAAVERAVRLAQKHYGNGSL